MAIWRDLEKKASLWLARRAIAKTGMREWWSGLVGGGSSGFTGAAVNRLTFSQPSSSNSVNADLDGQLEILRSRARWLAAGNEFAKRFLSLVASNVVGPHGPKLQVRAYRQRLKAEDPPALDRSANDAIEIHWKRWSRSADITGKMSLAHFLRVAIKQTARDGEVLVRIVRNRAMPYGVALQLLEADRLDVAFNKALEGGRKIRQGVEIDSAGRPLAYYLRASHPGDREPGARAEIERVPASDIRHLFLMERAEQVRGYTWMHAVIRRAGQLDGFEESAVVAARVGASKIAALIPGEDSQGRGGEQMADAQDGAGNFQINAEAGDLIQVPPGYSLESWDPQYPHENFESFVNQCLRALAMGVDVATHNLSGNMRDVNFSSARIAELSEREIWMGLQDWFIESLMLPVYREWLASGLLLGQITFDFSGKALPADKLGKFSDAGGFQGRRWAWVDPSKEADASGKLLELGLVSRTEICASQGRDFEDVVAELAAEKKMLEEAGLPGVVGKPEPVAQPMAPVVDPAEVVEATGKALAAAIGGIKAPEVVVENNVQASAPPEVNVPAAQVLVENRFDVPAPQVNLEARIEGATVTVNQPHPARKETVIERDQHHEAVRTVETYEMESRNG